MLLSKIINGEENIAMRSMCFWIVKSMLHWINLENLNFNFKKDSYFTLEACMHEY